MFLLITGETRFDTVCFRYVIDPTALIKAKLIVYNFGFSGCNRVRVDAAYLNFTASLSIVSTSF